MKRRVQVTEFQEKLSAAGKYTITVQNPNDIALNPTNTPEVKACCSTKNDKTKKAIAKNTPGTYYCPMHCEGDKVYNKSGDCSVCGMDLVPLESTIEDENKTYIDLLYKMKIALTFTIPIFIIAMLIMVPNNPLLQIMSMDKWNWVQFILSLPVVFYACWLFLLEHGDLLLPGT